MLQAILWAERTRHEHEAPLAIALGEWHLSAALDTVPRRVVESLVRWYLHLSFVLSHRGLPERCLRCFDAREEVVGLEAALHVLTDQLEMPAPNTFRELEKYRWDAVNGRLASPGEAGVEIRSSDCQAGPMIKGTAMPLREFFTAVRMFLEYKGFFEQEARLTSSQAEALFDLAEELLLATARPLSAEAG